MAYQIYQQLESGMGRSTLTESTEVGYTRNADINATRFEGKTVAGALDNINNVISSLSTPIKMSEPIIKVEYDIIRPGFDTDESEVINGVRFSNDVRDVFLENGSTLRYSAKYIWSGDNTPPSKIVEGNWETLTENGVYSDPIEGETDSFISFKMVFGVDRYGLTINSNGNIYPDLITDKTSAEINFHFKNNLYFGELDYNTNIDQNIISLLNKELIKNDTLFEKKFENVNVGDDKRYFIMFPKEYGDLKIIVDDEDQTSFWQKIEREIILSQSISKTYYIFSSNRGAYKNSTIVINNIQ